MGVSSTLPRHSLTDLIVPRYLRHCQVLLSLLQHRSMLEMFEMPSSRLFYSQPCNPL